MVSSPLFQFHTVQLKVSEVKRVSWDDVVSIPYGSIKGVTDNNYDDMIAVFQFHTVQLKDRPD